MMRSRFVCNSVCFSDASSLYLLVWLSSSVYADIAILYFSALAHAFCESRISISYHCSDGTVSINAWSRESLVSRAALYWLLACAKSVVYSWVLLVSVMIVDWRSLRYPSYAWVFWVLFFSRSMISVCKISLKFVTCWVLCKRNVSSTKRLSVLVALTKGSGVGSGRAHKLCRRIISQIIIEYIILSLKVNWVWWYYEIR